MKSLVKLQFINNLTLWKKLIIIMITLFLCIIIVALNLTMRLNNSYFENIIRITDTSLSQLRGNLEGRLKDWSSVIDALIDNRSFTHYMGQSFDSDYDAYAFYTETIAPFIESMERSNPVESLSVYSDNTTVKISRITNNVIQNLDKEDWFDKRSLSSNGFNWAMANRGNFLNKKEYLCCYKLKYLDISGGSEYMVYTAFIDQDRIYNLLSEESKDKYTIVILDDNNQIVCCSKKELAGKNINDLEKSIGYSGNLLKLKNNTMTEINNVKYLYKLAEISNSKLSIHNWKIVYMVPAGSIISGRAKIWISSIAICVLCFIVSIVLILFVSENITSRIHRLINEMKRVRDGKFDIDVPVSGKDEIGVIEFNFNEMLSRINILIKKVYEADLKIKDIEIKDQKTQKMMMEAEIISLQSQINPHYLFNTLETIRMELIIRKQRELAAIIKAFAEGFRTYVKNDHGIHMLYQEMQILQNFIMVQKFRYGDRVSFSIQIDESLYNCIIPKLVVQPLLENAAFHGIEPKPGGGFVDIIAFRLENSLIVQVYDNGIGIEKEDLKILNDIIYNKEDKFYGGKTGEYSALRNVHNRIQLFYGQYYGLSIESVKNEFTRIKLVLPFNLG